MCVKTKCADHAGTLLRLSTWCSDIIIDTYAGHVCSNSRLIYADGLHCDAVQCWPNVMDVGTTLSRITSHTIREY